MINLLTALLLKLKLMQHKWLALFSFIGFQLLFANQAIASEEPQSVDSIINAMFKPMADAAGSLVFFKIPGTEIVFLIIWLAIACLVFTFYFGFVQIRKFPLAIDVLRGRFADKSQPGQITAFQALSTALSGTVGLGNIAGVAIAITIGGPGAMVWMILMGFMGMATKFVECTLGVKYRHIDENGKVAGGPMYYLSKGLTEMGFAGFGKFMGITAALLIVVASFGIGNLVQSNQAAAQIMHLFGWESGAYIIGIVFALITATVIVGGITSIASVTSKLVPFMAIFYVISGLIVIIANISALPEAIGIILKSAFTSEAGIGGIIGVMIQGFKRATFSSEAGLGTASIAHSAVKTDEPTTEGLVGLLEPFIDTIVICSITALVIVITGAYKLPDVEGVTMTAAAFATHMPSGFTALLTISVALFAFSTMISWSYYGEIAWKYLFGDTAVIYKLFFCATCVVGAAMNLGSIIDLSDALIFALAFFNIIGMYMLMPIVKKEVSQFFDKVERGDIG